MDVRIIFLQTRIVHVAATAAEAVTILRQGIVLTSIRTLALLLLAHLILALAILLLLPTAVQDRLVAVAAEVRRLDHSQEAEATK